jgi:signal transduction histidine kinase
MRLDYDLLDTPVGGDDLARPNAHDVELAIHGDWDEDEFRLDTEAPEIALLDRRGCIVAVNSSGRAALARGPIKRASGAIGARYVDVCKAVLNELDEASLERRLEEVLSGQTAHLDATFIGQTPEGRKVRQVRIAPLRIAGVTYFAAVHEDVSERAKILAELRETSDQLLHAQEDERQRIAIELHDSMNQYLVGLVMGLGKLRRSLARDRSAQGQLDKMMKLAQGAIHETRSLSYLMNASAERAGLEDSTQAFVKGFGRRTGLKAAFRAKGPVDSIHAAGRHAVFRVIQEALMNVHRHARASRVTVSLASRQGTLLVRVADNGGGIAAPAGGGETSPPLGVGIPGMRARIEQLGGHLDIATSLRGTIVSAAIPLGRSESAGLGVAARRSGHRRSSMRPHPAAGCAQPVAVTPTTAPPGQRLADPQVSLTLAHHPRNGNWRYY